MTALMRSRGTRPRNSGSRSSRVASPGAIGVAVVTLAQFVVGIGDPIGVGYVASGAALFFAAVGLVVVSGWARQVNLGQYGFLGVGAWVAGALPGVPFALRVLIGGAAAAALAVPVGLAASRLRGLALGALTLLVGLTLWSLGNVPSVMRLVDGGVFTGVRVDRPAGFTGDQAYALLSIVVAGAALALVLALRRSRTGQAMAGLGTPRALVAAGWSPRWLVVAAFVISAGLAGAGGVLLAANYGALSPTDIVPFNSLVLYAFLFVGGAARPAAAVLAAVIIAGSTAAGSSAASTALVGGLALAAGGALLPDGFLERIDRRVRTRRHRRAAVAEAVALEVTT